MKRGKSNWIVEVIDEESEESEVFGPYTKAQAQKVEAQIKKHLREQAEAADEDSPGAFVSAYPISKWSPPEIVEGLKRPACPFCGDKLGVWHEDHGGGQAYGHCNNPNCPEYPATFLLDEGDGKYVIRET